MKKLFLLLVFVAAVSINQIHAQNGKAYVFPSRSGDTLINTDTVARIIPATAGYSAMGIAVNVTKLTGSAITGNCLLYQSLDGVNYGAATDSAVFVTNLSIAANLTTSIIPTYTQTAYFRKNTTPSVYYMVVAISSGTVSEKVQFVYTARPYYITRP